MGLSHVYPSLCINILFFSVGGEPASVTDLNPRVIMRTILPPFSQERGAYQRDQFQSVCQHAHDPTTLFIVLYYELPAWFCRFLVDFQWIFRISIESRMISPLSKHLHLLRVFRWGPVLGTLSPG